MNKVTLSIELKLPAGYRHVLPSEKTLPPNSYMNALINFCNSCVDTTVSPSLGTGGWMPATKDKFNQFKNANPPVLVFVAPTKPKEFTIKLTHEEAKALHAVMQHVGGLPSTSDLNGENTVLHARGHIDSFRDKLLKEARVHDFFTSHLDVTVDRDGDRLGGIYFKN